MNTIGNFWETGVNPITGYVVEYWVRRTDEDGNEEIVYNEKIEIENE